MSMLCKKVSALLAMLSIFVFSAMLLAGCGASNTQKVLKIGVVGPESGGAAQLGQGQRKAVQMAVEEINAKKLAGDWKLEVFFEDDEGNPTKSASATNKLIQAVSGQCADWRYPQLSHVGRYGRDRAGGHPANDRRIHRILHHRARQ